MKWINLLFQLEIILVMIIKYDYRINMRESERIRLVEVLLTRRAGFLEWSIKIIISFSDLNMCVYKCMYIGVCKVYVWFHNFILWNSIYILYINIYYLYNITHTNRSTLYNNILSVFIHILYIIYVYIHNKKQWNN